MTAATEVVKTCTNKGCAITYTDSANNATACQFHSYGPIFHEGLKGWGCCAKRVITFEEFLAIPGCHTGFHSDEPEVKEEPVKAAKEVPVPRIVDGVESYGAVPVKPSVPIEVKQQPTMPTEPIVDPEDDADAVVSVGAVCKRTGCEYAFVSDQESKQPGQCQYHSGSPIFHEGSKGWTCCGRKVLEFDEFLKLRGCKTSKHMFVGPKEESKFVECRNDWFQSPTHVTISLFAKKVESQNAKIEFQDQKLLINLLLPDGNKVRQDMSLFQPIVPAQCSFKVMKTKIEITLKKANGISWPALEPTDNVTSWTTFGTTGQVGSVGSKDMHLSKDSAIYAARGS